LTFAAVMLVSLSAAVSANDEINIFPVSDSQLFDGIISEGEYGEPVAYLTTENAADLNTDYPEGDYSAYLMYNQTDPFFMDTYLYIAYRTDGEGDNRLFFCADLSTVDGKVLGSHNGLTGGDHWDNDCIQLRASADADWTGDPASDNQWGTKLFNIVVSAYTWEMDGKTMADGDVLQSSWNQYDSATPAWDFSSSENGGILSACDHAQNRPDLQVSGCFEASMGLHGERLHMEIGLDTSYFATGTDLEVLDPGDDFPFTFIRFVAKDNGNGATKWAGEMSWSVTSTGYSSGYGLTRKNIIISEPVSPPSEGGEEGDALSLVCCAAVLALGAAWISKKMR
ncbi:MAG: hypothetical protein II797_03655, partial [Clostridia bacterium]|nr:hypothetical protein [Clostridia bacterium]